MQASTGAAARDDAVVLKRFTSTLGMVDSRAAMLRWSVGDLGFVTLDDLRGFGREGLLQAARRYDEARGVPFGAWAEIRVKRAVVDGIRQWGPRRGERRS